MEQNWSHVFTPGELAQITGISTEQQRDWRRRELIVGKDEPNKHAQFDLITVAELLVLKRLIDQGIPVSRAKSLAEKSAQAVARFAAGDPRASRYIVFYTLATGHRTTLECGPSGLALFIDDINADYSDGGAIFLVIDRHALGTTLARKIAALSE